MKKQTLQSLRKNKELTQEQASKILGISTIYLSMLPSDSLKLKMSKLYGCEIGDIFLAINSTKRLKKENKNVK